MYGFASYSELPYSGLLTSAPPSSFAVVDTFLPKERRKKDWNKKEREKAEIRKQLTDLYYGIEDGFEVEPEEKAAIIAAITPSRQIDYEAFQNNQHRYDLLIQAHERLIALKKFEAEEQDDEEAILLLM